MRSGIGYDIHRFEDGRRLVLGGLEFPGERGLAGHSDADVLLHAIIDALLGGAGLGDIGRRFPPDDPQWAGADSAALLERTCDILREAAFEVVNVDTTVIAERPRLAERLDEMRVRIAAIIGIDRARVNVKATTNEGIGDIGRGEGIAALAIVSLYDGNF
jgi:2-C-methyl-D-erythritol 2,4-cyclodiphosphate synthase